jgi:hypothetical protein
MLYEWKNKSRHGAEKPAVLISSMRRFLVTFARADAQIGRVETQQLELRECVEWPEPRILSELKASGITLSRTPGNSTNWNVPILGSLFEHSKLRTCQS